MASPQKAKPQSASAMPVAPETTRAAMVICAVCFTRMLRNSIERGAMAILDIRKFRK